MNKRILATLPEPELINQCKGMQQTLTGMKGIVTAERLDIGGKDTLVL